MSTIYTKQHFVLDVIAGGLLAYGAFLVFLRDYPREAAADRDRDRAPRRALAVAAIFVVMAAGFWTAFAFHLIHT